MQMTLVTERKKRRTPHVQPPNLGNLVWQIVQSEALCDLQKAKAGTGDAVRCSRRKAYCIH
jgi:hypothetical protein